MDCKGIVEELHNLEAIAYGYNINGEVLGMDCSDFEQIMVDCADYITELLEQVEKVKAERDSARHNLSTVQKMVQEYQEEIIPGFRERAEKAERARDAAVKDLEAMARSIRHQKVNDDACCFACEHNCPVEDYCPGWDEEDCFEWRGKEVCKG